MTFSTAALFSQNLVKFIDFYEGNSWFWLVVTSDSWFWLVNFYEGLNKLDPDNLKQGELKSEVMYKVCYS